MANRTQEHRSLGPLRNGRSMATLRLQLLMKAEDRIRIGERIKDLRNASPHTSRSIADYVGVGERAVAQWIAGGGITWENAKKVAELFEVDVQWLWTGREKTPNPDVFATWREEITESLDGLRSEVRASRAELLASLGTVREAQAALLKQRVPARRGKAASGS